MSFNFLLLYTATVFIATIIPGPSMLLALTHGMQFGAKKTIASAMGNLTITVMQASISIGGLGTLLLASETAFQIVKFGGAAYLIYLGFGILFLPGMAIAQQDTMPRQETSPGKMYLQAACVTAGNPKAIVFFTAVFPQFINPETAFLPQYCLLMTIGSLIAFGCFMLYAISGQKLILLFSNATTGKYINKIIGATFIGAGISLAAGSK